MQHRAKRGRTAQFLHRYKTPYLFILPFFLIFFVFQLYPMIQSLIYSFQEYDGLSAAQYVGLKNYQDLFHADNYAFWDSLKNTAIYWVVCSVLVIVLSVLMAMLLNYKHLRGTGAFKTLPFLPYVCASVAVALVFKMLFDTNSGLVNEFLQLLGAQPVDWLTSSRWSRVPVIILFCWRSIPWFSVIVLSGLLSIPGDYYEAAIVDGANFVQQFFRITLPLLGNILFFCFITVTCDTWKMFNESYVLKGPAYSNATLFQLMYEHAFTTFRLGYASAIGYVLAVITILVSIIQFYVRRTQEQLL